MVFFRGTQERVRNSRSKRAIDVRAIAVLLYFGVNCFGCPCIGGGYPCMCSLTHTA